MDALTFNRMVEERIAAKDAERKAAEERAAAEALEWELASREADRIARRHHKRRRAALKEGDRNSTGTQVVRREQEYPVASRDHENEAQSSRDPTTQLAKPVFPNSDLKPTKKRKRFGKLSSYRLVINL